MRESLTFLAIAVILVLSALLVGPYFVDWNRHRDWLAAKLSEAAGAQIRIAGPIDVELLPRPIFRASQISIAGATPQDPHLAAERLDAELSIDGLLQGAVTFVEARLASPRLDITMRRDGSLVLSPLDIANPQKFQFNHLSIENGTIAVKDEGGADRYVLGGIAAQGEAETLFGPVKLSGSAQGSDGALKFRLNTGAYAGRKVRGRLVVDGSGAWSHAEAEGSIALQPPDARAASRAAVAFAGNLNLLGSLHVADGAAPVPWHITATGVTADPLNLAAPAVELRAGADGRALVANGGALWALGNAPAGLVKLRARQLDLDHITAPPDVAPDTPRPSAAQWLAALRGLLDGARPLPLRLTLDTGIDAVTAGDLTLTDAAAVFEAKPDVPPRFVFSIAGPDATRLSLDGTAETGASPAFKGRIDAATRDIGTVAGWLDPLWPGTADWIAQNAPTRAIALKGNVDLSRVGFSARDMVLTAGGSTLTGTASLTAGVANERPRVFADLQTDTFDPEQWPDLRRLTGIADPLDLSIGLRSEAVTLARSDTGSTASGRVALHLTKRDKAVTLDEFTITGFGGADVSATAALDADRHLRAEGRAAAKDAAPLAGLLRQLMPGSIAEAFAARATALSPLDLRFGAEAVVDTDAALMPIRFSGDGTAGGTRFAGSITPEALRGGGTAALEASLTLDAPDVAGVLRQAGLHADLPLGTVHADLHAKGVVGQGFDATAAATLPDAKVSFQGRLDGETGHGRLAAVGTDVVALLHALGSAMAPADRAWSVAADVSWTGEGVRSHLLSGIVGGSAVGGDLDYAMPASTEPNATPALTGNLTIDTASMASLTGYALAPDNGPASKGGALWSAQPFSAMPAAPRTDLALRIGSLDLWPGITAREASLKLKLAPGSLALGDLTSRVMGGTVGGNVTVRRDGPAASLSGQLVLNGLTFNVPSLAGKLSGTLNVAGTGPSPAGLIGSLAGEGTLAIAGASTPHLDPGALGRVATAFDAEDATIEDGPVRDALSKALDRGPLALGDLKTPTTIAAGVLRVAGVQAKLPDATVSSDAALDLSTLSLSLRTALTAVTLPKDWKSDPPQVTVLWKGPLAAPSRNLDAGSFVNGLAARAIAREQERIELMKDDLRERSFFARRLKQIEAEQQAARDAAQLLKAVPQPPRPGDIRLPVPSDQGASSGGAALKLPDISPPAVDELTKFLNNQLSTTPLPPSRPTTRLPNAAAKPIDLTPAVKTARPATGVPVPGVPAATTAPDLQRY